METTRRGFLGLVVAGFVALVARKRNAVATEGVDCVLLDGEVVCLGPVPVARPRRRGGR